MRTFKPLPQTQILKEYLDYDPDTGLFVWKKSGKGIPGKGEIAGCIQNTGYAIMRLQRIVYYQHRLAWKYIYDEDPQDKYIDHINRNKSDNRINNLKVVTMSENCNNKDLLTSNTSGYTGVSWSKHAKKWSARFWANGKGHLVGYFDDPEEAHFAYLSFKNAYVSSQHCI